MTGRMSIEKIRPLRLFARTDLAVKTMTGMEGRPWPGN
jgi:hypothetical protein